MLHSCKDPFDFRVATPKQPGTISSLDPSLNRIGSACVDYEDILFNNTVKSLSE